MLSKRRIVITLIGGPIAIAGLFYTICVLIKCNNSTHLDLLLRGDKSVSIASVTIVNKGIAYIIDDATDVDFLCQRARVAINDGYYPKHIQKCSGLIFVTFHFVGDNSVTVPAYVVVRDGRFGMLIMHNSDIIDDPMYYWIGLDAPHNQKLQSVLEHFQLSDS